MRQEKRKTDIAILHYSPEAIRGTERSLRKDLMKGENNGGLARLTRDCKPVSRRVAPQTHGSAFPEAGTAGSWAARDYQSSIRLMAVEVSKSLESLKWTGRSERAGYQPLKKHPGKQVPDWC